MKTEYSFFTFFQSFSHGEKRTGFTLIKLRIFRHASFFIFRHSIFMKKLIGLQRYLALFLFLVLCPKLQEDSLLEARMNQMRKIFRELKKAMSAPTDADKRSLFCGRLI